MRTSLTKTALLAGASACTLFAIAPCYAQKKQENQNQSAPQHFTREVWPAQRVVLLLPLRLGAGWNLDREQVQRLLPVAEQKLQIALQRTGKFSTMQTHRYNAVFLRAVQEKQITREQAKTLTSAPTLENVQQALSIIHFDQPPLVAEFFLEEVVVEGGASSPMLTAQVTGKLYEANQPVAIKTVVVTSEPAPLFVQVKQKKKTVMVQRSPSDRLLAAADDAFAQIAREFVKPLEDITLPGMTAPGASTPGTTGGAAGTAGVSPPVITVPKDQALGTFPATQQ